MPDLPELPPIAADPLSLVLLSTSTTDDPSQLVDDWTTFLDVRGKPYEILLVNDAGADQTAAWSAKLAGRSPVRVLRDPVQRGSGAGFRVAAAVAQYPLLACVDADYRFVPADLERMLAEIDKVHLATGLRTARSVPLGVKIVGGIYRLLVRILFGLPLERLPGWLGWRENLRRWRIRMQFGVRLSDPCCPFRLYRREIFARIPLQSHGRFVHVEILAKANFLGCLMTEAPLQHYTEPESIRSGEAEKQWRKDWKQVFSTPDFGPAKIIPPLLAARE